MINRLHLARFMELYKGSDKQKIKCQIQYKIIKNKYI